MNYWRPLRDSKYEVSRVGEVRRVLVLNPAKTKAGYLTVGFRRGKSYNHKKLVHRLVAEAFLGECPAGKCVNHINGKKWDNRLENLEYVTAKENGAHAARLGLYRAGTTHPKSKLTVCQIRTARKMYGTGRYTYKELAKEYGVTKSTIHKAVRGVTYSSART